MHEIKVPLKSFLEELKKTEKNSDRRRDFHVFYLKKHDLLPEIYPLTFNLHDGALSKWALIYQLWVHGQFLI